jgi:hypothetical protein
MSFSVFFYGTLMSSGVLGRGKKKKEKKKQTNNHQLLKYMLKNTHTVLCGSSVNTLDHQQKLDQLELIPCYLKVSFIIIYH